jgi:hypothetical protein
MELMCKLMGRNVLKGGGDREGAHGNECMSKMFSNTWAESFTK